MREVQPSWIQARKAPPQNWFDTSSGVSGAQFVVSFSRDGLLSELSLNDPDPTVNDLRFTRLRQSREIMESAYEGTLSFDPLEGRKSCRIGERSPGAITDQDSWPDFVKWFVDSQRRLREAVAKAGGIPTSR